jgi:hypothetical protein
MKQSIKVLPKREEKAPDPDQFCNAFLPFALTVASSFFQNTERPLFGGFLYSKILWLPKFIFQPVFHMVNNEAE